MSHDDTVNAGDIARLVDVGRAAVSNWRRRHEDFPQPVGGTASSPLFSLQEIEDWLYRNGKSYRVSLADRAWQRLRASGDDLHLGHLVSRAGAFLLAIHTGGEDLLDALPAPVDPQLKDPQLIRLLANLASERGHRDAFEFLCERYLAAHSRRLVVTPDEVATLMVRLACPAGGTVLDPACGLGTLLNAAPADQLLGQEINETAATIAAVRALLSGSHTEIVAADSLRDDGFAGRLVDAVVCDPPFNERAWGFDELTGDPRWEYGLPPRGESELAWVQHCLGHVRPGGLVAVLMPTAAASRRAGKRIRGNLLRAGALRAVLTLRSGGPDLWLLCRPEPGERPPSQILLAEAGDDLATVENLWQRYLREPETSEAASVIELLDDDVDLSPARRLRQTGQDLAQEFTAALDRLRANELAPPELQVRTEQGAPPGTTIGELVKAGLITISHAPAKTITGRGELPLLTADDVAAGGPPSERTPNGPGLLTAEPGDVVASATGVARVVAAGAALGPHVTLYRVDQDRLDPDFLAGCLRCADPRAHSGSSRLDIRRTQVPRLPLVEQREYGRAFRQLIAMEDALREQATLGETLVRLGFAGLKDGYLRPRG
ncbi:MAG: N-6 DNA methylase [Pseudonocardiaceae bacterium]|nr:N-6 DNA methylase [Pseudonocardiaceae bacterium]